MAALHHGLATAIAISVIALTVGPANSQDWVRAGIKSLGVDFDLPPRFFPEKTTSQGSLFRGPNGATLVVGGGGLDGGGFRSSIQDNRKQDELEGWNITYDRVTSKWASYSGIRDGQIRYVRAISLCGDQVAVFVLDYSQDEKLAYDPVVVRMVRSMKSIGC